jgi:hypothetical protein
MCPAQSLNFKSEKVRVQAGLDTSTESFDAAVMTVISAIKWGYHPNRDDIPLESSDWARLACGLLAAVG